MKQIGIYFFVCLSLLSCFRPNIYNDDVTVWKMPRHLKTADFFYDIESIYRYEGKWPVFLLKIKDFYWQDDTNKNYTIESAFFIMKAPTPDGGGDYSFQYRRYITLKGEIPTRDFRYKNITYIPQGPTLYLTDSNDNRFVFAHPRQTVWYTDDGLYEGYDIRAMGGGEIMDRDIVGQLMNTATEFRFYLPSDNLQTNGFELQPSQIERLKTHGIFVELENNSFSLTAEELEHLREELPKLIARKHMPPREYIKYAKSTLLK